MNSKIILIIGAGKSATYAIEYLATQCEKENWKLIVADADLQTAKQKISGFKNCEAKQLDINNEADRSALIQQADLVVSMMPPAFHSLVLHNCLKHKKHFTNASYVTPEMKLLNEEFKKNNLIVLCEMGLDPGIDHMSAMQTIHRFEKENFELTSFKSYCGGLVAPESDNNPWHYKFSWNPRNVILAGQGTAQYLHHGKISYIPYNRLFSNIETIKIKGYGEFEAYANRDSLSYIDTYNLPNINYFLRGTLRKKGFCESWNALVQLGITDDSYTVNHDGKTTWREFIYSYLNTKSEFVQHEILDELKNYFENKRTNCPTVIKNLESLDIFSDDKLPLQNASPAQQLQHLLEQKWKMEPTDKDMIVMQHQFIFKKLNETKKITSTLVMKGENQIHTAMAKTVGLPLAIGAVLILKNEIKQCGVLIPTIENIYHPVLKELENFGVNFIEEEK
jgi:saccharopine dehydrogenase (NADP+, L-glutamate forming)